MMIAHLPSGYLLARVFPAHIPFLLPAVLLGAVLPDLDMFWFYLVDDRSLHHHRYWVHIPVFWVAVALLVLPVLAWRGWLATGVAFFAAILLHLLLDSISGGILWGAPLSNHLYTLVEVQPTHGHWILSFAFHWTFLLELLIWAVAIALWRRRRVT